MLDKKILISKQNHTIKIDGLLINECKKNDIEIKK